MVDIRRIKKNYENAMVGWTEDFIKKMVVKGLITEVQFKEVTGKDYVA